MNKVHRYYLPRVLAANGREVDSWSVWFVDEGTGSLMILGDFGNWAHTWGHAGRSDKAKNDFRLELLSFDEWYIGKKLGYGVADEFDAEGTVKHIRQYLLELRRGSEIRAEVARKTWNALNYVECQYTWGQFLDQDENWDWAEFGQSRKKNDVWLNHLMTVTLPRFKAAMRAQIYRERALKWFRRDPCLNCDRDRTYCRCCPGCGYTEGVHVDGACVHHRVCMACGELGPICRCDRRRLGLGRP